MDLRRVYGQNVAARREQLRLKQKDLADLIGVSVSYASQIESGEIGFRAETLEKVAAALGVEPFELLVPKLKPPPPEVVRERVLFQAAHPDTTEPTPIKPSATLSPLCSKAPTVDDVAAMVTRFAKVSPARRSVALAILFDDASLAPEVEAFLALYDSKHPREA